MSRKICAGAAASIFISLFTTGSAFADERPLIWQPQKASDRSYSVKLGLTLPTRLEPQAGIDMGMSASRNGAVVNAPVKVWGNMKMRTVQRPAYASSSAVDFSLDALHGSGAITMNYYDKRIATPVVDVERRSSYSMRYDGVARQWQGVEATQSLHISRTGNRGTALVIKASATDNFRALSTGVGLEQRLSEHMTIRGSVDRSFSAPSPTLNLGANYRLTW